MTTNKNSVVSFFSVIVAAVSVLVLSACSSGEKKPEYYDAVEAPSLEIPQDLDRPDHGSALEINAPYMPPPTMAMQEMPPRISATTSGIDSNSRLSWSAEGIYLLVEDTPESARRRLKIVVERSGMQRIRVDEIGVYRFDYYQRFDDDRGFLGKLAFWRDYSEEDYSGAYQVYIRPEGENSRVYIKYADGTDCEPDAAEHVLSVLGARMG